jgi:hypothetical protein
MRAVARPAAVSAALARRAISFSAEAAKALSRHSGDSKRLTLKVFTLVYLLKKFQRLFGFRLIKNGDGEPGVDKDVIPFYGMGNKVESHFPFGPAEVDFGGIFIYGQYFSRNGDAHICSNGIKRMGTQAGL